MIRRTTPNRREGAGEAGRPAGAGQQSVSTPGRGVSTLPREPRRALEGVLLRAGASRRSSGAAGGTGAGGGGRRRVASFGGAVLGCAFGVGRPAAEPPLGPRLRSCRWAGPRARSGEEAGLARGRRRGGDVGAWSALPGPLATLSSPRSPSAPRYSDEAQLPAQDPQGLAGGA